MSEDARRPDLSGAGYFDTRTALLVHALSIARPTGLFLEFGVGWGTTINQIAAKRAGPVYGFDSFHGLPEAWHIFEKGAFACQQLPSVPGNVELVVGMFADTLPGFLASHPGNASFVHVDCDLYSSTRCVLDHLEPRLSASSVILFDELIGYNGWEDHEYRAFTEFIERTGKPFRYDGRVTGDEQGQVCVVLT